MTIETLRAFALGYPGAEEGVACEGTALEKRTIRAGTKAFVFLGRSDVMLKLRDSLGEATDAGCKVGAHGWVTATVEPEAIERLERWIDESYRLLASAKLVALLGP